MSDWILTYRLSHEPERFRRTMFPGHAPIIEMVEHCYNIISDIAIGEKTPTELVYFRLEKLQEKTVKELDQSGDHRLMDMLVAGRVS